MSQSRKSSSDGGSPSGVESTSGVESPSGVEPPSSVEPPTAVEQPRGFYFPQIIPLESAPDIIARAAKMLPYVPLEIPDEGPKRTVHWYLEKQRDVFRTSSNSSTMILVSIKQLSLIS